MPALHIPARALRKNLTLILLSLGGISVTCSAQAIYPDQPIRLVVPFGAGGITDVVARLIGQKLGEELNQTIVIENKPGAGGTIAAQTVARAKPDGYTLLLGTVGTQVVNKLLYKKLNYDPATFEPVSLISNSPYVLGVSNVPEVKNLQDLIDYAQRNPDKLNYGSAGIGSSPHLGMELLNQEAKIQMTHVPFKSGAEAVNAAMGGQVQIVLDAISVIVPQAKAGKLRLIALADDQPNSAVPDLTTAKEQGFPVFVVGSWNAIVGPEDMPADRVSILSKAISNVLHNPRVKEKLSELGIEPLAPGRENYVLHVQAETDKWKKIVEASGAKLD